MSRIYLLDTEPDEAAYFQAALAAHGEVRAVARPSLVGLAAEVVSGFIHTPVDSLFLAAHPALRLVATRSTGVEHIDLVACRARGSVDEIEQGVWAHLTQRFHGFRSSHRA